MKRLVLVLGILICAVYWLGYTQLPHGKIPELVDDQLVEITNKNFPQIVLNSETPVLVDFWTPWCEPSLHSKPVLIELAKKYRGQLIIGEVDLDQHPGLGLDHNVRSIPTMVYFKNGKPMFRTVGLQSREVIIADIEEILRPTLQWTTELPD